MNKLYTWLLLFLASFTGAYGQYCVPSFPSGCTGGDLIENFTIPTAAFSHLNTGCSPGQYGNYTSMLINLSAGVSYGYTVTHDFAGQKVKIWVDLNNDGNFTDAAPELLSSVSSTTTGSTYSSSGTITLPATTPNGSYRMRVMTKWNTVPTPCNNQGYGEAHDYTVMVGPPPSCLPVQNPTVTSAGVNTAQLSWTNLTPAPAGGYQIYYSTSSTAPTAATVPNATAASSPFTLGGLTQNTTYYWWIRADCGGTNGVSMWIPGTTFTTISPPAALPYFQQFTTGNDLTLVNGSQTNKWMVGANAGNAAPALYISNNNSTNVYDIAATSKVYAYRDIIIPPGSTSAEISFDYRVVGESSWDNLQVFVGNTTATLVAGSDPPATLTALSPILNNTSNWTNYLNPNVNVTAYAGNIMRLVFYWKNDFSGGTQPPAGVDNISIKIPTCKVPSGMAVSNVNQSGATLSWTAPSPAPAGGYQYYFSTSPIPPIPNSTPSGTATATTVTLTTLPSSTTYYWWVRAVCTGGDRSTWVQGPTFTTTQLPASFPYIQTFDSTTNIGFTYTNSTENKWMIGTAVGNPPGAMYISDDNVNNTYSNTTTITHAYRDILIPAGTTVADLYFDWRGDGEPSYDYTKVWLAPTTVTPVAGSAISTTSGAVQIGNNLAGKKTWQTFSQSNINMSAYAGKIVRLIFEWRNDTSIDKDPPIAIDNIRFTRCNNSAPATTISNLTSTTATLNWQQDVGNASYEIRYRIKGSANWSAPIAVAALAFPATQQTYVLTNLTPGTLYEAEIAAVCSNTAGAYTHVEFTTECDKTPPSGLTVTNITSNSAVLSWGAKLGATTYSLEYRVVGTASWNPAIVVNGTTYTLTNLLPYTQYEFRVASICSPGLNGYSTSTSFLTRPTCEMAPVGLTSSDLTAHQILVKWEAFPGATYVVRWRKVGAPNWTTASTPNNQYLITGVDESVQYEIEVANVCNGGTQTFSNPYVITTPPVQVCAMASTNTSDEYISEVRVTPNGHPVMTNTSTASTYTSYQGDDTKVIRLTQGSFNNQISVSKGWSAGAGYDESVAVWIDFNRNGVFESAELILNSGPTKVTPVTATFAVPANAYVSLTNDRFVTMRVILVRGNMVPLCGSFDNGEVEDYKVLISKAQPDNLLDPKEVNIYPNPTSGLINVLNVEDGAEYKIYNAAGQIVKAGTLLNGEIDATQLIQGVYRLDITKGGETVQKRFIKQ